MFVMLEIYLSVLLVLRVLGERSIRVPRASLLSAASAASVGGTLVINKRNFAQSNTSASPKSFPCRSARTKAAASRGTWTGGCFLRSALHLYSLNDGNGGFL